MRNFSDMLWPLSRKSVGGIESGRQRIPGVGGSMENIWLLVIFIVLWIILNRWVFPRLGIST